MYPDECSRFRYLLSVQSLRSAIKSEALPLCPLARPSSLLFSLGALNRASKLKSPISARCNIRVIANTRCAHNCLLSSIFLRLSYFCSLQSCERSSYFAHSRGRNACRNRTDRSRRVTLPFLAYLPF